MVENKKMVDKKVMTTEDALRATEKALGDAEWEGLDTTYLKQEVAGLRIALSLGQQFQTDW